MVQLFQNKLRTMKVSKFLILVLAFSIISCNNEEEKKTVHEVSETTLAKTPFDFGVWITADAERTDESYTTEFKKYKNGGIDEVLINTLTDPKILKRLTPIAKKEGLRVHAWIMTMNRPGDSIALQHPDWYMVSRSGKSCFDDRPYVDYYQWLSPSHPEAREHIYSLLKGLAKVEDVESVHLDYILQNYQITILTILMQV